MDAYKRYCKHIEAAEAARAELLQELNSRIGEVGLSECARRAGISRQWLNGISKETRTVDGHYLHDLLTAIETASHNDKKISIKS